MADVHPAFAGFSLALHEYLGRVAIQPQSDVQVAYRRHEEKHAPEIESRADDEANCDAESLLL